MNKYSVSAECYYCTNKRNIIGDTHYSCTNPDPKMEGHEHGIKHGWFDYPFNFDPVWKSKRCNNFKERA